MPRQTVAAAEAGESKGRREIFLVFSWSHPKFLTALVSTAWLGVQYSRGIRLLELAQAPAQVPHIALQGFDPFPHVEDHGDTGQVHAQITSQPANAL